jgi:hypothetical protein
MFRGMEGSYEALTSTPIEDTRRYNRSRYLIATSQVWTKQALTQRAGLRKNLVAEPVAVVAEAKKYDRSRTGTFRGSGNQEATTSCNMLGMHVTGSGFGSQHSQT